MKKNLFTLVFFALSSLLLSQNLSHECGNQKIDSIRKITDSEFDSKVFQLNNDINGYIDLNYKNNSSAQSVMAISPTAQYVIPVVVHIVLDPSNPNINNTTVSYAQVQSQIDALNLAFAKGYPTGPSAVDTRIQFCLAQIPMGIASWPVASEPGVIRYNDGANSQNQLSVSSTNNLINLTNSGGRFPFTNYLNIWVVNSIDGNCSGVQGYAINPLGPQIGQTGFAIDGVVIRVDAFGDNSTGNNFILQPHNLYGAGCPTSFAQRNQGKVLVHEVGHYLNLWHTFQNDIASGATCAGATPGTCSSQGDFCCDTPPSNVSSTFICGSAIPTSCGSTPDMVENYMYYATDPCLNTFTLNQRNRMWAYLNMFRSDLFTQNNLIATGLIGPNGCLGVNLLADFSTNNSCSNIPITFNPIPAPANSATAWNWTFSGGSISSSTAQYPVVTFVNPGTYLVTLTVNDGVNPPVTNSQNVVISSCNVNQDYIHNAQWYFGQYCGVNFSSGIPVPVNAARVNQTVFAAEGAYSYSDNTGNLIFYTDGINIWNAAHIQINSSPVFPTAAIMINSVLGANRPTNSAYGIIGVPFPNNPNMYLIFCAPALEDFGTFNNVRFVILNLTSNTVSAPQNLGPAVAMCEGLSIAPHCNGVDYWLIAHARAGVAPLDNRFYSFLISSLGVSNNPVLSANNNYRAQNISSIKISPNNQRIVIAGGTAGNPGTSDIGVYNFNNSTGVINNEQIFDSPAAFQFTGCSFSSNSQQIYASCQSFNTIVQFDLTGSSTIIGTNIVRPTYLQLGPDNNIYISNSVFEGTKTFMSRILNPNTPNNAGSFQLNAIDFSTITPSQIFSRQSIPNLMDGIQPPATNPDFTSVFTSCSNINFTMNNCWGGYVYTWNFGDGSPTVTGATVSHNYATAGPHNVVCTLTIPGLSGSIATQPQVINILNSTTPITGPINVCLSNVSPYIYNAPFVNGATYNWSISSNGIILNGNGSSQIQVQWNSGTTGNISVVIIKDACTSNGSLNVNLLPLPVITAVASPANVCATNPNSVLTASGGLSYQWNTGATTSQITVNPTSTAVYNVIGVDANKCINSANVTVTYGPCVTACASCPNIIGTSGQITSNQMNNEYCINNDVTIVGTRIFLNSDFRIASGVRIIVPSGANLIISHCHLYACMDMWQGIEVQPGGKLSILNNSLIEDAITAIDITNNTLNNNLLRLNNSTFNKNYTALRIQNYAPAITNYPFDITGCVFTSRDIAFSTLNWPNTTAIKATAVNSGAPLSSDIISNATYPANTTGAFLKAPHNTQKSEMGIQLVNVGLTQGTEASPVFYEFKLGTSGPTKTNVFDNIRYELHAFNSNINSINNVYQNTGFVNRAFGGRGIIATCDQNFNGRLKVTKVTNSVNKFIDCGTAIQTVDYFIHEITENEIRSSKVNNAPNPPANFLGVNGVNILTNRFYNCTVNNNEIYNIENGIIFTSSNGAYNIYGLSYIGQYAKELNIIGNTISANLIGSAVTTQYIKNAIVLQNLFLTGNGFVTRAPNLITVSTNQLTGVYRGIFITNFGKIFQKINNNNIDLVQDVFVTNNTEYGISFNNNKAYQSYAYNKAVNNTISGYGITNANNSAILSESSSGLTIGCNSISNTHNGLHFNGTNSSNDVVKNIMQNHQYGFVLNNNGIVGKIYTIANVYYFSMGAPNSPADNLWNGTWTGGKFKTFTMASSAQNSPMYVRNTTTQYNPDLSGSSNPFISSSFEYHNNGSLLYTTGPTPNVCTYGTPAIVLNGNGHQFLEKIVQNQVPVSGDIVKARRVQKNQVFLMLKEDPSLMSSSTVLQNFYTTNLTTNNEAFYTIEQQVAGKDLVQAESNLLSVTSQDGVDDAYKTFNECALHYSQGTFNAADSTALHNLCLKCPYTDGLVIFQARTLYNVALEVVETFNNNCTVSGNARMSNSIGNSETETAIYNAELFPNPTTNNFVISTLTETAQLKVEILDVQGKLISSEMKNVSNYRVSVDTDLHNGVYFINITDIVSGHKTVKKLVIQK